MSSYLSFTLLFLVASQVCLAETDKLLFVYQMVRHGATIDVQTSNSSHNELLDMGKRQMYLMGQELREKYVHQKKFLSEKFVNHEIFIRAVDSNKTIESAMAEIIGLYPNYTTSYLLFDNQTTTRPEFNISNATIQVENWNNNNITHALPVIDFPPRVHVYSDKFDTYSPYHTCPAIADEVRHRKNSSVIQKYLDAKYSDTLHRLAVAIGKDPATFTSFQAMPYLENINQYFFTQAPLNITLELQTLHDLKFVLYDYYNQTMAMNTTTQKAFLTQIFAEMIQMFQSTIDITNQGILDKVSNRIKFFMYVDHVEAIMNLANAFRYHFTQQFVPYASTVLIELHEIGDQNYYVNMSINGNEVILPGQCQLSKKCEFKLFVELVKSKTFYGDSEGMLELCGPLPEEVFAQEREMWMESQPNKIMQYMNFKWGRFIVIYLVLLIPALVILYFYEKRKQERRKATAGYAQIELGERRN